MGVLELGMKVEDVYKFINKEQIFKVYTYDANRRKTSYQIYTPDKKTHIFAADVTCDRSNNRIITRITVWHRAYPTDKNVRVGQTIKAIRHNNSINKLLWLDGNIILHIME